MATNSRDSTFEEVQSDCEISGEEINEDFEEVDDSDQPDIDMGGLQDSSESESEDESSKDEGDDEGIAWSQDLPGLMFQEFSGTPGIKVDVPNEPKAEFFFSLLFGDQIVDLIVRGTNRYARDKLETNQHSSSSGKTS